MDSAVKHGLCGHHDNRPGLDGNQRSVAVTAEDAEGADVPCADRKLEGIGLP